MTRLGWQTGSYAQQLKFCNVCVTCVRDLWPKSFRLFWLSKAAWAPISPSELYCFLSTTDKVIHEEKLWILCVLAPGCFFVNSHTFAAGWSDWYIMSGKSSSSGLPTVAAKCNFLFWNWKLVTVKGFLWQLTIPSFSSTEYFSCHDVDSLSTNASSSSFYSALDGDAAADDGLSGRISKSSGETAANPADYDKLERQSVDDKIQEEQLSDDGTVGICGPFRGDCLCFSSRIRAVQQVANDR